MKNDFFKMPERIFGISSSLIKLFLLPLLLVLIFLISFGLVMVPRIDSIKSLKNSITKIRSEIKETEGKRIYLSSVDQNELLNNKNYLSSAVLQEKNSYLLVAVVRNIADKFGFRVKSFLINPINLKDEKESLKVSDKNVATKLPIDIVLEGQESNVIDLLISMENSLPIMFVDKINILTRQNVSELSMTISSYYVTDEQNLTSDNLTINDLIPTEEENNLLLKISQFNRDDSLIKSLTEQGSQGKDYVEYQRENPFNL